MTWTAPVSEPEAGSRNPTTPKYNQRIVANKGRIVANEGTIGDDQASPTLPKG